VIKKRGNSWWVVVYTGRDPLTGKKRQKTGTAKTRAEARQLEARLIREAETGQHRAAGNKTVAELLDAWSEWRPRKGEIAERTMLGYRSLIEHKIIAALGELRLSRVDTATLDRFLAQLSERGTRCKHCQHLVRIGQAPLRAGDRYRPRPGLREREHPTDCARGLPMSPSAVRDVHAVLAGAFKQAQVWGWIDHNPMTLVTRPTVRRVDVRPPQVAQAKRLIDAAMAQDPELGLFLVLAVVLGARRGEVCRLRWSHIDLDRGEVLVGGKIPSSRHRPSWSADQRAGKEPVRPAVVPARRQPCGDQHAGDGAGLGLRPQPDRQGAEDLEGGGGESAAEVLQQGRDRAG
jgi:integrase